MESLESHRINPRHMVRPLFFDEEVYFDDQCSGGRISLYLEVDKKKSRISSLSFFQETVSFWTPFFSALCDLSRGMRLGEAKGLSWVDFLNYFEKDQEMSLMVENCKLPLINKPLFLLSNLIDRFAHTEVKAPDEALGGGKLICRCFGVYEKEIQSVISKEGFSSFRGILDETCAGGGCATCKPQIQEILSRESFKGPTLFDSFKETGKVPRIDGMTPVEVILKSEELLNNFEEKEGDCHRFEILGLRGRCLDIKSFSENDPLLAHQVERLLKQGVSRELSVKLSHVFE
ncbi:MAG: (2Fe-2S)-binding protein [Bdellovibrionota bacterium]|nr:(2Fe-2S)-binding protein [Bdellovibrionota bacterium]